MLLTIVITTFHRSHCVGRAVSSALEFCRALGDGEVVVVDDGGFDDSLRILAKQFLEDLASGRLRLMSHTINRGVSAAKNTGFIAADGQWICFLDSDDEILPDAANNFLTAVQEFSAQPILFFRCIDQTGKPVGVPYSDPIRLDMPRYFLNADYGELLTIIRKDIAFQMPYVDELRGFEGLGCLRIIQRHGHGVVLPLILRRYYLDLNDRLSTPWAYFRRGYSLARGHWMTFVEFHRYLSFAQKLQLLAKVGYYFAIGTIAKFKKIIG